MIPDTRLTRALTLVPRKLYELGVVARTALYESGWLEAKRLGRPVLSVGNITLGGTGKTPIVEMLAAFLRDEGYAVAILTRGYGRKRRGREVLWSESGEQPPEAYERGGDEPALLARRVPGVHVVVDSNRHSAGAWAERELNPDVFILDDGFQHLRLARDLDILVIDATDPFGGCEMLPYGRLREPLRGVRRAGAVIVTRADRPFDDAYVRGVIRGACGEGVPVCYARHEVTGLRPLAGTRPIDLGELRGRRAAVLAAIGNPGVFLGDMKRAGVDVVADALLPDHHDYSQRDVDAAIGSARAAGAEVVLTTEKDAVKLERLDTSALPFHAVQIAFRSEQEAQLKQLCLGVVRGKVEI
jgi:tetraacyldisaccharide 4'-kinase